MTHFSGFMMSIIKHRLNDACSGERITCDNWQQNALYGVHQARLRLANDDTDYRLILAPADAPIMINGVSIDLHFTDPLAGKIL